MVPRAAESRLSDVEVEVRRRPDAARRERLDGVSHATASALDVLVAEVQVEQVDEPRQLRCGEDVLAHRLAGDGQRRLLRAVVDIAVIRALEAIAPGFLKYAQTRAWFSVNGAIEGDWTATIPPDSEVIILPAIAGG